MLKSEIFEARPTYEKQLPTPLSSRPRNEASLSSPYSRNAVTFSDFARAETVRTFHTGPSDLGGQGGQGGQGAKGQAVRRRMDFRTPILVEM